MGGDCNDDKPRVAVPVSWTGHGQMYRAMLPTPALFQSADTHSNMTAAKINPFEPTSPGATPSPKWRLPFHSRRPFFPIADAVATCMNTPDPKVRA